MEPTTYKLKIKNKIQETADAFSLIFEIPSNLSTVFQYKPGQFVTLQLKLNGQVVRRSYSMASSPLTDSDFKITIKRVPNGLASNHLADHVSVGDELEVVPPAGHFFRPPLTLEPHHLFLFAAGSGITPLMSILKTVLAANSHKVTLVYANRYEDAIIFFKELEDLAETHKDRLRVIHILSQPGPQWTGYRGRCTEEVILQILDQTQDPFPKEFYLCGPNGFMDLVEQTLKNRGVSKEAIHKESFASAEDLKASQAQITTPSHERVVIGRPENLEPCETLKVILNGEETEVPYSGDDSVLETLLNAGLNPPYSCMDGACMACMGKVKEGRVYQEDPGILTEDNLADHETLTCQARPATKKVVISYDDI